MNIRNVLRTYSLLRQLTDDESALLETLRNATEAEREMLVETLAQQRSSTTKRAGKKLASKGASKSSRASSLAEQIKRAASNDKPSSNQCVICGNGRDHVDHFQHSPHYHEFNAGKSPTPKAIPFCGKCGTRQDRPAHHDKASGDYHEFVPVNHAQPARGKSSTNGEAIVTTASSGDETVSAGAVAGGSNE